MNRKIVEKLISFRSETVEKLTLYNDRCLRRILHTILTVTNSEKIKRILCIINIGLCFRTSERRATEGCHVHFVFALYQSYYLRLNDNYWNERLMHGISSNHSNSELIEFKHFMFEFVFLALDIDGLID